MTERDKIIRFTEEEKNTVLEAVKYELGPARVGVCDGTAVSIICSKYIRGDD